jgi:hypothetical protein
MIYPLMLTPLATIHHTIMGRRRRKLEESFAALTEAEQR